MNRLKKILDSKWFFPILFLYYGLAYILWGEIYYLNNGVSIDGCVYYSFIGDFRKSIFFDSFYMHRILPSICLGLVFKLFSINLVITTAVVGFQAMNLVCIIITCILIKELFKIFKVSLAMQLLGFVLFIVNFSTLKFSFYLPVMTDSFAMCLSATMLYFYIKKKLWGVTVCTFMACFTWQMLFYQGLILMIVPFQTQPLITFSTKLKNTIRTTSAVLAILLCMYFVYILNLNTKIEFIARINKKLLPLSLAGIGILYFFFIGILFNTNLFQIKTFFKTLKISRILIAAGLVASTVGIVHFINPPQNVFYPLSYTLTNPFTHGLVWPLITIVAHTTFWGVITILLIFFWNDFSNLISKMGWGIVMAFGFNLLLFSLMPETRCLINMFPWIIIFFAKAIDKYQFSKLFYTVVIILALFISKIWLRLNPTPNTYNPMQLDENGSMGFPDQKLWMHIGPWMNQQMYLVQGAFLLAFTVVLFFILYKIEIKNFPKIQLVKRYQLKNKIQ